MTATVNYKEVFQLAKNKGYSLPFTITLEGNDDTQFPDHHPMEGRYIELCLIQKWLRDIHKTDVTPKLVYDTRNEREYYPQCVYVKYSKDTSKANEIENKCNTHKYRNSHPYEISLLKGINEALQLI